jgi:hypothetical protein
MTQHEYVFVAISIILGLALTRLLHTVGMLIRAHRKVTFHWSTSMWGICVMTYSLQFWWVGWDLRSLETWSFSNFAILIACSIFVYGAAEMALPVPDGNDELDFLQHSQGLGRLSALSMLLYFMVGPYINIAMFGNDLVPSLALPIVGMILMGVIIGFPRTFKALCPVFALYTFFILYLTA